MRAGWFRGAILALAGGLSVAEGLAFGIGTAARPGAGTWPVAVGLGLVMAGLAVAREGHYVSAEKPPIRDILSVIGGVLVMALLYRPVGLLIAALASAGIVSGAFCGPGQRWAMPVSTLVAIGLWLVLARGLDLPIRLWPSMVTG